MPPWLNQKKTWKKMPNTSSGISGFFMTNIHLVNRLIKVTWWFSMVKQLENLELHKVKINYINYIISFGQFFRQTMLFNLVLGYLVSFNPTTLLLTRLIQFPGLSELTRKKSISIFSRESESCRNQWSLHIPPRIFQV